MDEQQAGQENVTNEASVDPNQPVGEIPIVDEQGTAPVETPPSPPPSQSKKMVYGMMAGGILLVILVGFVVFRLAFNHEPNATDITPTPVQEVIVEPIGQWQTYSVGDMSIKHSATWGPESPKDGIFTAMRDSKAGKGTFNPGKGSLEIVKSQKTLEQLQPRGGVDVRKDIEVNGVKGIRFEGTDTGIAKSVYYIQVFFPRSDGLYKVYFFSQDKSLKDQFLKEFEQILSTVTFATKE